MTYRSGGATTWCGEAERLLLCLASCHTDHDTDRFNLALTRKTTLILRRHSRCYLSKSVFKKIEPETSCWND
jgi:hypothetical protein